MSVKLHVLIRCSNQQGHGMEKKLFRLSKKTILPCVLVALKSIISMSKSKQNNPHIILIHDSHRYLCKYKNMSSHIALAAKFTFILKQANPSYLYDTTRIDDAYNIPHNIILKSPLHSATYIPKTSNKHLSDLDTGTTQSHKFTSQLQNVKLEKWLSKALSMVLSVCVDSNKIQT